MTDIQEKQLKRSEALIKAQKTYYDKVKNTDNFKAKRRQYANKTKEKYNTDEEFRKRKQQYQKNYYYKKKEEKKKYNSDINETDSTNN